MTKIPCSLQSLLIKKGINPYQILSVHNLETRTGISLVQVLMDDGRRFTISEAELISGAVMDNLRDMADYRQQRSWAVIADSAREARAIALDYDVPVEALERMSFEEYRENGGRSFEWVLHSSPTYDTKNMRNRMTHP